jgi:hypothetical protein
MRRIILNAILIPILALLPAAILAEPAYAACGNSSAAQQVSTGIDETTNASCDASGVNKAIALAVDILTLVVGAAAVIALIWSGFKYVTSGGDTNKVANAKSTLIYAVVGIAVVGLAQVLVHFIISTAANTK